MNTVPSVNTNTTQHNTNIIDNHDVLLKIIVM